MAGNGSSTKRRLPVIASDPAEAEAEARPPWHWVGFGTVLIFAAWLPLSVVARMVAERITIARLGPLDAGAAARLAALPAGERRLHLLTLAAVHALALLLGAAGGGYVVGRFGRGTGVREAALAGLMVGLIASLTALGSSGLSGPGVVAALSTSAVALALATAGAALGGWRGTRARR